MEHLSKRELKALFWTANGRYPDEIAILMQISRKRVNNILYEIRQKLKAHTTAHAVAIAIHRGYIKLCEIYDTGNPPTHSEWFKNAARFLSLILLITAVSGNSDELIRVSRIRTTRVRTTRTRNGRNKDIELVSI